MSDTQKLGRVADGRFIVACRSCGAPMVWGKTANGSVCPYNVVDGQATLISHFTTCAQAGRWSKRR